MPASAKAVFLAAFLCLASFSLSAVAAELPRYDIKAWCKSTFPEGYEGMAPRECFSDEEDARDELAGKTFPEDLMRQCDREVQARGGSYQWLKRCLEAGR